MKRKIFLGFALAAMTLALIGCDISTTTTTSSVMTSTSTTLSSSDTTTTTTSTATNSTSESTTTSTTTTTTTVAVTTVSTLHVFTLEELAQYDGSDGSTAYVAINGLVYDVTHADKWRNGVHEGLHLAGTDATALFALSPHSQSFLNNYTVVGTLG